MHLVIRGRNFYSRNKESEHYFTKIKCVVPLITNCKENIMHLVIVRKLTCYCLSCSTILMRCPVCSRKSSPLYHNNDNLLSRFELFIM